MSLNRSAVCIGDRVTFRCQRDLNVNTFTWSVSSLLSSSRGYVYVNNGPRQEGLFTLNAVRSSQVSVSTLEFYVNDRIRSYGSTITVSCTGGGTEESTTVSVGNQYDGVEF